MNEYTNRPEITNLHESEEVTTSAEIKLSSDNTDVTLKNIHLEDEVKETLGRLIIKAEKLPLDMSNIKAMAHVNFAEPNEPTKEFMNKVEQLAELGDDKEKIDGLLKLLKSQITYGYESVLEAKAQELGIDKEKLDKFGTKGNSHVNFNEMLEYGIGICGHLSEAYLYLANKAGLKGVISWSHPNRTPTNIVRTDNGEKLFKSAEVGAKTSNHAWVEIQANDGSWIPVDPSTELTGTTVEGMEMFKEAGYTANLTNLIDYDFEPGSQLGPQGIEKFDGTAAAGEKEFTIDPKIGLRKTISFSKPKDTPQHRVIDKEEEKIKVVPSNQLASVKFIDVQFVPE